MKVLVYPEKQYEEFGAARWQCEWQEVKPAAEARIGAAGARGETGDIDPDTDLNWHHRYYKTKASALREAKKIVNSRRTAFGTVTVIQQCVDWFVEEDRVAEWSEVGEAIYVD